MRLKGSNIIYAIIDWCNWKILILLFRNIPPVLHRSDKKETIETRSLLETYQNAFYFSTKNIYKPYCFKCHHLKNFAEEIFAIDQFWQNFAEEIFAIDQFWIFFAEEIFANKGQNRKNKFRKNFFRKNFFRKRFLPKVLKTESEIFLQNVLNLLIHWSQILLFSTNHVLAKT